MKKTYNKPTSRCIVLDGMGAVLQAVSGSDSLTGTTFGGTTLDNSVLDSDIKGIDNKSLWDSEW